MVKGFRQIAGILMGIATYTTLLGLVIVAGLDVLYVLKHNASVADVTEEEEEEEEEIGKQK